MSFSSKAKNVLIALRGVIFPLFLLAIVLLLAVTNYVPNTWLSGWDNLHSEFDFQLNWSRTVGASWQDHQGLGISAVTAYAADAPRLVVMQLLDIFFSANDLRYVYLFLCLYIGAVGIFYLIRWLLKQSFSLRDDLLGIINLAAFAGSLFYLFNLGTLQNFYAPIEMFPTQWAYLPWLLLTFFVAVRFGKLRNYLAFAFTLLLAAPMAYTPTIFFVFCLTLLVLGVSILISRIALGKFFLHLKRLICLAVILFCVNAFWILPVLGTLSQGIGSTVVEAKINQMASEDSFAMNVEYGTTDNLMLLKGFWFGMHDYKMETKEYVPMMQQWSDYQAIPLIQVMGYVLFVIVLFGVVAALVQGIAYAWGLILTLSLSLFALASLNPPLGEVYKVIVQQLPFLGEALRFPFTKFSSLTALLYAIFFAIALFSLYRLIKKLFNLDLSIAYTTVVAVILIIYCFPMFTGNLVYKQLQVNIPQEYFQLFDYFKQQPAGPRVATLPQQTFWSWNFYDWGYRGSGFLWYGIKQPTLDRAFDVWSKQNEQYYNEMSEAIYRLDAQRIADLAQKYQIGWFMYDASIAVTLNENHVKFYKEELIPQLLQNSDFKLEQNFNNHLYVISYQPGVDSYRDISVSDEDTIAETDTSYLQLDSALSEYFDKSVLERKESSLEQRVDIQLDTKLTFGSYWDTQKYVVVEVGGRKLNSQIELKFNPIVPSFTLDGKLVQQPSLAQTITLSEGHYYIGANNTFVRTDAINSSEQPLGYLLLTKEGKVRIYTQADSEHYEFDNTLRKIEVNHCSDTENSINARADKTIEGEELVLNARNSVACFFVGLIPNFNSSFLVHTSLDYRSLTSTLPISCVLVNERCWNLGASTDQNKTSANYQQLDEFTEVPSQSQAKAGWQIMVPGLENDSINSVALRHVTASYYPLLEEVQLELNIPTVKINASANSELIINYPVIRSPQIYKRIRLPSLGNQAQIRDCSSAESGEVNSLYREQGYLQMQSTDAEACIIISNIALPLDADYVLFTDTVNILGQKLKTCVGDPYLGKCIIEYELNNKSNMHTQVIPAVESPGRTRELRFTSVSRGNWPTLNNIHAAEFIFYPSNYVQSGRMESAAEENNLAVTYQYKYLPFWYRVETEGSGTIKLNQAYMPLWASTDTTAKHVKIDTWQNGWTLSKNSKFDLIYLPGLLELLGYALALLVFAVISLRMLVQFIRS